MQGYGSKNPMKANSPYPMAHGYGKSVKLPRPNVGAVNAGSGSSALQTDVSAARVPKAKGMAAHGSKAAPKTGHSMIYG